MKKINSIFLALIVTVFLFPIVNLPAPVSAQSNSDPFNCSISIFTLGTPRTVKTWSNPVMVETVLDRITPSGSYCATTDVFSIKVLYRLSGDRDSRVLQTGNWTIQPSTGNSAPSFHKIISCELFDFSKLGAKDGQSLVELVATADVTRNSSAGTTRTTITSSQPVIISQNSSTTDKQDQKCAGTTPGPGQTNTNTNSNTPRPPANTNVNINSNVNYDLGPALINPLSAKSIPELITRIINILLLLIGMAAVIMIIVGGFRMVMGGGNPAELAKAKSTIVWAIIGLVVALMSFSIVAIVQRLIQ